MRKILGTVLFAMSLMGVATVVLAQSSRDLTPVTGTEANRLPTPRSPFATHGRTIQWVTPTWF
jgi:hypothetical protein